MGKAAKGVLVPALVWGPWGDALRACPLCRAKVASGILAPGFADRLILLSLPALVLAAIGLSLYFVELPGNRPGRGPTRVG